MTKRDIILLHGTLGTKHQFDQLQVLLSEQFIVHTFNFDGHGESVSGSDFSIDLFTTNTVDFLRERNIQSTNIFGYSMGGYVGLNVARKHPELVNRIVTLGTKFDWSKEATEKETLLFSLLYSYDSFHRITFPFC